MGQGGLGEQGLRTHLRWTVVKGEGIWMGGWTGWKEEGTGFFRVSGEGAWSTVEYVNKYR
jgi:hypothetical protein